MRTLADDYLRDGTISGDIAIKDYLGPVIPEGQTLELESHGWFDQHFPAQLRLAHFTATFDLLQEANNS